MKASDSCKIQVLNDVVDFDDEISTGGTLVATVETLAEAGDRQMIMGLRMRSFAVTQSATSPG